MLAYRTGDTTVKGAENISDPWFVSWLTDSGPEGDSAGCLA